ncbi:MAG: BCCT family transporter [Spirochaetaceae bacterium]|nr:BCCT family transporter [Spirochaetaceae bacterium]
MSAAFTMEGFMIFGITIGFLFLFVIAGFVFPEILAGITNSCVQFVLNYFGWLYLASVLFILVFSIIIAVSPLGRIKLGKDTDTPEYSRLSWFAMLFSAGMGIGLVFWGAAEPVSHYLSPPSGAAPASPESLALAFRFSFLHWGFHPWAIYALTGLGLGYSVFRKGRPFLISSILEPVFGTRRGGRIAARGVDVITLLVTVFGVASSLGMGALQINSGLAGIFGISGGTGTQIIIIAVITVIYIVDARTGLNRGIKYLSNINVVIAALLLVYFFFAGPSAFIIKTFFVSFGGYLKDLLPMSLGLGANRDSAWLGSWTIFYWAWWISWGPFVGTFVARISRGRTIRDYITGVLVIPALFCLVWFAVFGAAAIRLELDGAGIGAAVTRDVSTGIFAVLSRLPFGGAVSYIVILLLVTFFVTSADSAVYVIAMFAGRGALDPDRRMITAAGVMISLTAIVFLYNGGLRAMQNTSIVMALPFVAVLLLICRSLQKELGRDTLPPLPRRK